MDSKNIIKSENKDLEIIDSGKIFNAGLDNILYIAFTKSPSKNFSLVMALLGGNFLDGKAKINNKDMFIASFKLNEARQANTALSIIPLVSSWKGTFYVFNGRKLDNAFTITHVIDCIVQANKCNNHLAHCLSMTHHKDMIAELSGNNIPFSIIFPCKKLSIFSFRYRNEIPVTLDDQVQAYAVEYGVDWCPYFNMENFKKIEE